MEARRAGPGVVVVHLAAGHGHHVAGGVIEGSRVEVLEISRNSLKCEEVTVLSDWSVEVLKEVILPQSEQAL